MTARVNFLHPCEIEVESGVLLAIEPDNPLELAEGGATPGRLVASVKQPIEPIGLIPGAPAAQTPGVDPQLSAACSQLIAPLSARKMTSCIRIARSTAARAMTMGTSLRYPWLYRDSPAKRTLHVLSGADRSCAPYRSAAKGLTDAEAAVRLADLRTGARLTGRGSPARGLAAQAAGARVIAAEPCASPCTATAATPTCRITTRASSRPRRGATLARRWPRHQQSAWPPRARRSSARDHRGRAVPGLVHGEGRGGDPPTITGMLRRCPRPSRMCAHPVTADS